MKTRTREQTIAWGIAINARRRAVKLAEFWDGLLQDELSRLPVQSSGWDGSETQRAARSPEATRYLEKRTAARLKIAELDATIKANAGASPVSISSAQ